MTVHRFDSLPSTNSTLAELAEEGAPEGTVVRAGRQTGGRGRGGRMWHSPPGNLYLSVLLRPGLPPRHLPRLSLLASLALLRALARPGVPFALKWPNDLLLGGRKAAGVLLEGRTLGDEVQFVVAGVGVNVSLDPASLPPELAGRVASLSEWGEWDREEIAAGLAKELVRSCGDWRGPAWDRARDEWWANAWRPRLLTVRREGGDLTGRPEGLDPDGALLVMTPAGPVSAPWGEIVGQPPGGEGRGGEDGT